MSLIAVVVSALLTLAFGRFVADIGDASARRGQAQTAADAVALAAVAEAGPYGTARPKELAMHYASLNHVALVECRCDPGATAVQVTVEADGVLASARAVIDPTLLAPAPALLDGDGLHPRLRDAVAKLVAAADGAVHVVSGYRPPGVQAELWRAALVRHGDPEVADDWVARPGTSQHERGLAVDLGGDLDEAIRLIEALDLPLYRPIAHEPWHFELLGSRWIGGAR